MDSGYKYLDTIIAIAVVFSIVPILASLRITEFFGWTITGGTYVAPLIIITIGLVTEVYGKNVAQRVTYLGLGMIVLLNLILLIISWLPGSPESANDEAFGQIAGTTIRITAASLFTFFITSYTRIFLTKFFEKALKIKSFGVRNYLNMFLSEAVNQGTFIFLAFFGTISNALLWQVMWQGYIVIIVVEILIGLVLPYLAAWLRKHENLPIRESSSTESV